MFDTKHLDTIFNIFLSQMPVKKAAPTEPTPQKVPKAKEDKVRKYSYQSNGKTSFKQLIYS